MKAKNKFKKLRRGIETMFRIVSANHQRLSEMADTKSHIMITVNSIILSVVITVLLRRIEEYSNLTIPTVMLFIVNATALIFSVLATRPSVPGKPRVGSDQKNENSNLLFFGNFYHMAANDYISAMSVVMEDVNSIYKCSLTDIHNQGLILKRKYQMLNISYSIFMIGFFFSRLIPAFSISHMELRV